MTVAKELVDLSGELDQLIHYDSPADAPPLPPAAAPPAAVTPATSP